MITPSPPPVRFVRSASGSDIACWTIGSGPPLVWPAGGLLESTERSWEHPPFRSWMERLAAHRTVTFFDFAGLGLSSASGDQFALASLVADLSAVCDTASPSAPCAVVAGASSAAAAIVLAAERPERVEALVLVNGIPSTSEYRASNPAIVTRDLADGTPGLYASVAAAINAGSAPPAGTIDHLRAVILAAVERMADEGHRLADVREYEVLEAAAAVQARTLVVQARRIAFMDEGIGRRLAATIPGAQLLLTEGDTLLPYLSDAKTALDGVLAFFGIHAASTTRGVPQTILFTDLAGSTAMQSRLGDAAAREVLRAHDEAVRRAIAEHHGREVKHTGDGMMAAFGSAADAVRCALAVKREIDGYNETYPNEELLVRFGLNAGEPIAEGDDLFGLSVSLAARIGNRGEPGQVLCSNVVRELLLGKGFAFAPVGSAGLKGLEEPVALFEVTA